MIVLFSTLKYRWLKCMVISVVVYNIVVWVYIRIEKGGVNFYMGGCLGVIRWWRRERGVYNIVGVFEGFIMERGDALRAGHYLISLLALKFVLLCLKLMRCKKGEFTCRE